MSMKRGNGISVRWKAPGNYRDNRRTNWGELGPTQVNTGFEEEDGLDRAVFRKLNLMVHWGERTGSGCVFIDTCLLKKGGYMKEWGNSSRWTMNNGGGVAGTEWERGGVVTGSGERKLIFLLDPLLPRSSYYSIIYKIYVGPFQTTVWIIPRRTKLEIFFLKTIFFFSRFFFLEIEYRILEKLR